MAERAAEALAKLEAQGGVASLPKVLTSREAKALMGKDWFFDALRLGALPGVQVVRGGAWRCARQVFVRWLCEVRDEQRGSMALDRRSGAAVPGGARDDAEVGAGAASTSA